MPVRISTKAIFTATELNGYMQFSEWPKRKLLHVSLKDLCAFTDKAVISP